MNLIEFGLILFLIIVLLIASVSDIRFQKIPNWLTYPTMFEREKEIRLPYGIAITLGILFSVFIMMNKLSGLVNIFRNDILGTEERDEK